MGRPPSRTVSKTPVLEVAFSLRERVDLSSQKEEILGKKIARKKGCAKKVSFLPLNRERKNQPEVFQTEVFSWTSARDVRAKMLVFPGFGGPERSFWPDVRRDIRPKTSSLG